MEQYNKKARYSIIFLVYLIFSGCTARVTNLAYLYTPSLPKGQIPATVVVRTLEDKRPEEHKKHLEPIDPVHENVTSQLVNDFRNSELFTSIRVAQNAKDEDILITGEIIAFDWKQNMSPLPFIPVISFIIFFGVPVGDFTGKVALTINVINAKSGELIKSYQEEASQKHSYNLWTSNRYLHSAGQEASYSFKSVVDKIKEDLLKDKDMLLSAIGKQTIVK